MVKVAELSLAVPSFTPAEEDLAVVNGPRGVRLFSRIEKYVLYPSLYDCLASSDRQRAKRTRLEPKIQRLKRACCLIDFTLEAPNPIYRPEEDLEGDFLEFWLSSFVRYIEYDDKNYQIDNIDKKVKKIYFDFLDRETVSKGKRV